jgi:hypothetical protein
MMAERERIIAENDRLKTDYALMRERADQLESRLNVALAERDHYMRFSTEVVTNLNNIRMTIDEAVRSAKHVAYKPSLVPVAKPEVPEIDSKGIENLIRRLPENRGEKDAKAK